MGIMLLLVGAVVVLAVASVVATRPDDVLIGEATVVGLGDPAADTMSGSQPQQQARTEWQLTTVTDLTDAEDLLDCLEAQGFKERELVVLGNSCFAIRWR
jgi:hypothetical protein